jgi:hypothetical protein
VGSNGKGPISPADGAEQHSSPDEVRKRIREWHDPTPSVPDSNPKSVAPAQPSASAADARTQTTQAASESIPPAERKAAEKMIREAYATQAQEELWREGVEMTVQARGTTLHLEYALAGKAFAFQFGEGFVSKNGNRLKVMGFKRVELTDGDSSNGLEADHVWSWNLNK